MNHIHHISKNEKAKPALCANSFFFQPKLSINQPNDIYEQEAEVMADKVMRMPSNKNENTFFKPGNIFSLQRKCAHCDDEEKLQMKSDGGVSTGMEVPSIVHDVIKSGGLPLDRRTRNFFEPHFGYDFSNVKIHNDSDAAKSAQSINALAYTSGNNIVFNEGQYSPESVSGKKLLAHELTHVVQQSNTVQRKSLNSEDLCEPDKVMHDNGMGIAFRGNFNNPPIDQYYGISSQDKGQWRSLSEQLQRYGVCVDDNNFYLDLIFQDGLCCMKNEADNAGLPPEISVNINYQEYGNMVGSTFSGYDPEPARDFEFAKGICTTGIIHPNFLTFLQIPISKGGYLEIYIQMYQPDTGAFTLYSDVVPIIKCSQQRACSYNAIPTGRWLIVPDNGNPIHRAGDKYEDGPYYEMMLDSSSGQHFICNDNGGRLNVDNYQTNPLTKTDLDNAQPAYM